MAFEKKRKVKVSAGFQDVERYLREQGGTDPSSGESGRRDDGGAGVREPRKPRPTRPGAAQAKAEPATDAPPAQLASS